MHAAHSSQLATAVYCCALVSRHSLIPARDAHGLRCMNGVASGDVHDASTCLVQSAAIHHPDACSPSTSLYVAGDRNGDPTITVTPA